MLDGLAFVKTQQDHWSAAGDERGYCSVEAGGAGSAIAIALLEAEVRQTDDRASAPPKDAALLRGFHHTAATPALA